MELEIIEVVGLTLVMLVGVFLVSVFAPSGKQPVRASKLEASDTAKDGRGLAQWRRFT